MKHPGLLLIPEEEARMFMDLSRCNPVRAISKKVREAMEDRREIRRMVRDMQPDVRKAYAEAFVAEKLRRAEEKARLDAAPFHERMKARAAQREERIRDYGRQMEEVSKLFAPNREVRAA